MVRQHAEPERRSDARDCHEKCLFSYLSRVTPAGQNRFVCRLLSYAVVCCHTMYNMVEIHLYEVGMFSSMVTVTIRYFEVSRAAGAGDATAPQESPPSKAEVAGGAVDPREKITGRSVKNTPLLPPSPPLYCRHLSTQKAWRR